MNRLQRCGTTLVETMVIMMMGSVVLGGVAVFLAGMWRSEQSSQDYDSMLNSIVRVAAQFRSDVHSAVSVELPSGNVESRSARFTASLANQDKIEYQAEPGQITRVVRAGEQIKHRESYMLPPSAVAHWEAVSAGGNVVASLLINRPLRISSTEPSESRTMRIDAISGLQPSSITITQAEAATQAEAP